MEVDQVLSGTLRVVRKIADGGMGTVWLAEHLVLGTEVAVKVLSGPWAAVPDARSRFLREARMTASIDCQHVVTVIDCRPNEADEPYLVLELLHGENLEQRVHRHGALSIFEVAEIVTQACVALAATHDANIVHRDLKPENVFLVAGPTTFVKLLDYGIAKPMNKDDCLDIDHLPAGTPQYMSAEHMFEPETTDARSDLFSLGAVAYFALTRRTPFDATSMEGLYLAIDGGVFRRPSELRPELPPALDRWFEKALAHDANARFQNAREMADALHDALRVAQTPDADCVVRSERAPVSTSAATGSELAIPMRRMRRSRTSAIAALALAGAMSLVVWRTDGPEVQEAIASTNGDPEQMDGGGVPVRAVAAEWPAASATRLVSVLPAPSPARAQNVGPAAPLVTVLRSDSEACRLIEGDPSEIAPAIRALLGATPGAPVAKVGPRAPLRELEP